MEFQGDTLLLGGTLFPCRGDADADAGAGCRVPYHTAVVLFMIFFCFAISFPGVTDVSDHVM